jgi:hypothetical protein
MSEEVSAKQRMVLGLHGAALAHTLYRGHHTICTKSYGKGGSSENERRTPSISYGDCL